MPNPVDQMALGYRAFQSINTPAVVVDREGKIVLFTPKFSTRYFQHADSIPRVLNEIFNGNSTEIAKDVRNAQVGSAIVLVKESLTKTLRESFLVTPLREGNSKPTHYLLYRAEQTALDRGFDKLNTELEQANVEAAKARIRRRKLANENKHLGQFASLAAHELKAPMRNIKEFMSILEEDHISQLDEAAKEIIAILKTSATRMHTLVGDLLAHSKSSNQQLHLEALSIREIVNEGTENLCKSIADTNALVNIEHQDAVIHGDRILLRQLFENLISNSIKYRSKDRDPQISIRLIEGNYLELEDNGLGFDSKHSETLFEPFKRLYSASEIEGTGIGLATCKSICERHGWTITATGESDKGAKFTINLRHRHFSHR